MRDQTRGFFQYLYDENESNRPRLDNLSFKQLSENTKTDLERVFMEEEILDSLKECKGDKALGPYGYNVCFCGSFERF